ncbi:MAG: toxin-antitoxin system YwqK family antitoxin [Anaerolineae bacterium]
MNIKLYALFGTFAALSILFAGCSKKKEDEVISQRYIHKYGYALSKDEWESKNYPGEVITNLSNGITVTATYENGVLHGPSTHTYPYSQTIQAYYLFNQGELVKEILYDITGMPVSETIQLSPSRYSTTLWFSDGTPMSIEEYADEELLEGQYFTLNNEIETRVEKGDGQRIRRNKEGVLLSKDEISRGYMVKREAFFSNGSPESVSFYARNQLHGEKKTYTEAGGPLTVEEWVNGQRHGKSTYFNNGVKYLEVSYLFGAKNGLETHFIDGEIVSQEIPWENDRRHGIAKFYIEGIAQMKFYYNGEQVSQKKYDELTYLDEMIISKVSHNVSAESLK